MYVCLVYIFKSMSGLNPLLAKAHKFHINMNFALAVTLILLG